MSGIQKVLIPETTITDTATYQLDGSTYLNALGAHGSSILYYSVTGIGVGDTWTFTASWYPVASTRSVTVASVAVTATGEAEIDQSSAFSGTNLAVPMPNVLTVTKTVAGASPTLTFEVYLAHGD